MSAVPLLQLVLPFPEGLRSTDFRRYPGVSINQD
jgi:hypothetical protein